MDGVAVMVVVFFCRTSRSRGVVANLTIKLEWRRLVVDSCQVFQELSWIVIG